MSLIILGVRVVFGLDVCNLFPLCVLNVIPLIGGVHVHRFMSHTSSLESRGSGWLPIMGPSATVVVGQVLLKRCGQWLAPGHRALSSGGRPCELPGMLSLDLGAIGHSSGRLCTPRVVEAVVGTRLWGTWQQQ